MFLHIYIYYRPISTPETAIFGLLGPISLQN